MADEDKWVINCSDEELGSKESLNTWTPLPQDIIVLYELLDSNGVPELDWQCPGRRSPSLNSVKSEGQQQTDDEDSNKQNEPNEFDFDDEFSEKSTPKIARKRVTQSTSAQRRVACLDKVMFDIQRHRKLDAMEQNAPLGASSASPILKLPVDEDEENFGI